MQARPPPRVLRAELPALEAALLWCMRAWVVGHCRGADVSGRIGHVLARLGVPGALGLLDGFMQALGRGARRTIEVDCVCHPDVSADEQVLLDVLAREQREDHDGSYAALARLTTEAAAIAACDFAQRLTLMLSATGKVLRDPPCAQIQQPADAVATQPPRWLH